MDRIMSCPPFKLRIMNKLEQLKLCIIENINNTLTLLNIRTILTINQESNVRLLYRREFICWIYTVLGRW